MSIIDFTVYSEATGQVLFSGTASDLQNLAPAGCQLLEGVSYPEGWIDGGVYHPLPPKPSEFHVFDYTTKQWVDPRTAETQWPIVRAERDKRLQASDWAALPDVPLTTEKRSEWAAYRQALRDVTLQPDPFTIIWPTKPE